jgi:hypothetical protein
MKKLFLAILAVASLAMPAAAQDPAPAPSPYSAAILWDFKKKDTASVVLTRIDRLENILGTGLDFDLDGFAGVYNSDGAVVGGVALGFRRNLDAKGKLTFGVHGALVVPTTGLSDPKQLGLGVIVGVSYRF